MNGFRKEFLFPSLSVANWFPGHMAKGGFTWCICSSLLELIASVFLSHAGTGMRAMARKLQYCDCVLEVHDARVSFEFWMEYTF